MPLGKRLSRSLQNPAVWLIHLVGILVPRRWRADWRQEWVAELRHRERLLAEWDQLNWRAKLDLLRRSLGAGADALWLQSYRCEDELIQDLRFGLRMLMKNPGFTSVAVLTLALGIGANTAIFSVVNAVLLRPLPYRNADDLMMFNFTGAGGEEEWYSTPAAHLNLRHLNTAFTDVAAWGNDTWPANLTGDGEPERLQGFKVSANFFQTLGVEAVAGRTFISEEDQPGDHQVVVISYDLWQRRYGGDAEVIGRSVLLNGAPYRIIGVMPASFRFVLKTDVWTTLAFTPADLEDSNIYLHQVFRLKPGVASAAARAEVDRLLRPFITDTNAELRGNLIPLQAVLTVGERDMLFILLAAVGFVLAVACVNITNLLLARASSRRRELAIRAALGAARGRIVRQLLIESALLALLGSALGLGLARWCIPLLVSGLPESVAAKNWHVTVLKLDGWALGFTFALGLATTLIFGLLPALWSARVNLNETLKAGGGRSETAGRGPNRFRAGLVVAEVALAMVLLVGAGLMMKSFWRLSNTHRGFEPQGVLTARVDPAGNRSFEQVVALYRQLLERVSVLPGVEHAGLINSWDAGWRVAIAEHPPLPAEQRAPVSRHQVSPDYFRAMRIPLRAGRWFTDGDVKGAQPVAIIDETLAKRYFPDEDPLGKHLRFDDAEREIVGIVGATRAWKTYSMNPDEAYPRVYIPYQQEHGWRMALMVRVPAGAPTSLIPAIRQALAEVDKEQPIHSFKLLEDSVAELRTDRRFSTALLAAFAALAIALAAIGIYAVMSYSVTHRTPEIGLRQALGARRRDIFKLIVGRGMRLVALGLGIGLCAALALTRWLEAQLFEVRAADPLTYIAIAMFVAGVALAACYIPARRAMNVDPGVALRCE